MPGVTSVMTAGSPKRNERSPDLSPVSHGVSLKALLMEEMQCEGASLYTYSQALRWMTQLAAEVKELHALRPMILLQNLSLDHVKLTSSTLSCADVTIYTWEVQGLAMDATLQKGRGRLPGSPGIRVPHTSDEGQGVLRNGLGSYLYQAPEMLKRQRYGDKVDVYALGCILYELFTRDLRARQVCSPTKEHSPEELKIYALKVARGFRPILPATWPHAVASIIQQCWAQDPTQRPTASELIDHLRSKRCCRAVAAMDRRQKEPPSSCSCQ